jgi:hypothetical protein
VDNNEWESDVLDKGNKLLYFETMYTIKYLDLRRIK